MTRGSHLHLGTAWGSREAKDAAVTDNHEAISAPRGESHTEVTVRRGCVVPYDTHTQRVFVL
jgi:hypothetical protein